MGEDLTNKLQPLPNKVSKNKKKIVENILPSSPLTSGGTLIYHKAVVNGSSHLSNDLNQSRISEISWCSVVSETTLDHFVVLTWLGFATF